MGRGARGGWIGLVLVAGLAAFVLARVVGWPDDRSETPDAHGLGQARSRAVREAAHVGIPGAHFLATGVPADVHGDDRASGNAVTTVFVLRRRLDLSEVPMDDRRGGPVEALLALSAARDRVLLLAGFDAMGAEWSASSEDSRVRIDDPDADLPFPGAVSPPPVGPRAPPGSPALRPRVRLRVTHESDSGGGSGVDTVDLNAARIAHYRLYLVPRSGATLFVRDVLDQGTRIVESEFSYADRTLVGVEYATGSYILGREPGGYRVHESIVAPD